MILRGATRNVLLTKKWAIKFPRLLEWRLFLCGLLANLKEREFARAGWPELCPVKFWLPLGLLIVMPKVRILTATEFQELDYEKFVDREHYRVPAEDKPDSFGWLDGKIVAVDYGS